MDERNILIDQKRRIKEMEINFFDGLYVQLVLREEKAYVSMCL
jgi:hypothetical protein